MPHEALARLHDTGDDQREGREQRRAPVATSVTTPSSAPGGSKPTARPRHRHAITMTACVNARTPDASALPIHQGSARGGAGEELVHDAQIALTRSPRCR